MLGTHQSGTGMGDDHTSRPAWCCHPLDFVNQDLGLSASVAVELNFASGKALIALQAAIEAAEQSGGAE